MQRADTPLPESLFAGTAVDQPYSDYILMARPDATLEAAKNLPDTAIDDGNSRTYMYAYILSK